MLLLGGRTGEADAGRIEAASALASERLAALSEADRRAVNAVAPEDLRDFDAVLQAARYLLVKYDDRRELRALLRTLVGVIERSTDGLGGIDDEMGELVLSAEDSIRRIREAHASVGSLLIGSGSVGGCAAPGLSAPAPSAAPTAPSPSALGAGAGAVPAPRPGVDNLTARSTRSDTAHYQCARPDKSGAVV